MKKLITLTLSIFVFAILSIPTFAATNTTDDLSSLTDEIVTTANNLLADKLKSEVTANDIDYNNAYKIYVGEDVFKADTADVNELTELFGDDGYIYELPLYINGDTILVSIAKGQSPDESVELTEEERQSALANVGKWQVTAVKYYNDETVNYVNELQSEIGEVPENTILVGGLPYFKYAVALIPDESGEIQGLVPLSEVPGVNAISYLRADNKNIYKYEEMKEYINQLPANDPDEASGYGFLNVKGTETSSINYTLLIGIVVVSCIVIGLGTITMYRRKVK